jgi:hypothetical protein
VRTQQSIDITGYQVMFYACASHGEDLTAKVFMTKFPGFFGFKVLFNGEVA